MEGRFDCLSPAPGDKVGQVGKSDDLDTRDQCSLTGAGRRHDDAAHALRARGKHGGEHPAHGLDAPVEGKLADDHAVLEGARQHQAGSQRD